MNSSRHQSNPTLSPSMSTSLRALVSQRRVTWREALDGSVVGALAGLGSALVVLRLARRRRT